MNITARRFRTVAVVTALALSASLAACSDESDTADTSGATETTEAQLPSPVIVDVDAIDGTTVSVPLSNVVVIDTDTPTSWTATVADPSVASFTPGSDDGSASFNPGLKPLAAGTTTVTLTDGTTTVTFTLEVTA